MSFIASRFRSLAALGFIALTSGGGVPFQPAQDTGIREVDVPVPMRDGVVLRADVIRPAGSQRFPTLVYRTPYGKADAQRSYTTFQSAVSRGYAVVIQDVRGRYASAGEFRPYQDEGRDGYDTIEWAAAQPWSNGAVGTFGLSYPGAVQWLAAVENPPHLKAMVPGDDILHAAEFFLCVGRLGRVVARLDLGQHRARRAGEAEPSRRADRRRGGQGVERRGPGDAARAAARQRHRTARRRAVLLRMAPSSAGRSVLEFRGASRPIRSHIGGGTEPVRVVRRQLRPGGGDDQLRGTRARPIGECRERRASARPVGPWR